ncbi:MAG: MFS transporter [Candidatus Lindowbacteria bacterium]|nr:MFS transporter [Candidatus Lindowbacteria bacterium]
MAQRGPKLFYGFYIVGACFVTLFMLWGMVINTFPIFLKPISVEMGWGRQEVPLALMMGAIGMIVAAPIAGRLIDRIGARPVMTVGALIVGLGLLTGSRVTQLWQICTIFAFIGCGLICSTVVPCSLVISNWFVARRGTFMGIAFMGTSIGGMVASYLSNWIILNYGWRVAFLFSGLSILVIVTPVTLLVIRTRPSQIGLEPYRDSNSSGEVAENLWGVGVKEAFTLPVFWQITAVMFIVGVVTSGIGNHNVAYLTDLGHSPTAAAVAWMTVMGVMVLGKLAFGPLADRWGAKNAMAAACVIYSAGIVILFFAQPYSVAIIFAIIYGFASGAPLTINPLLTATNLGMKNFGVLYGILNIMGTIGGAIGPIVAGAVFEHKRTYIPVFIVFVALMLLAGVVAWSINTRPHQFAEQVETADSKA